MKFSSYVDELVQNSECFSFDAYNIGLRRYIKARTRSGQLGKIELTSVDPNYKELDTCCLLLGETNRMITRYPLISKLLNSNELVDKRETDYYKTLWRYYKNKKLVTRIKGRMEIKRKIERIFKMNEFIRVNRTLTGIDCFLRGQQERPNRSDYPINLIHDFEIEKKKIIQLDGSHRRCISFYNNIDTVQCINVNITDIINDIQITGEPYLNDYLDEFKQVIRSKV